MIQSRFLKKRQNEWCSLQKKKIFSNTKGYTVQTEFIQFNEIKVKENFYNVNGKLYNANRKYTMLIEN